MVRLVEVGGWHRASFSILRKAGLWFVVRQCRPGPVSSQPSSAVLPFCRVPSADAFAFFTITSHIHGRLVVGNGTAAPTNQ